MRRSSSWLRALSALVVAALVSAWPAALQAQVPAELADALVRELYRKIHDDALRPPDVLTLLHQTTVTAQRMFAQASSGESPPLPILAGQEDQDLTAVAEYVKTVVSVSPHDADRIMLAVLRAMVRTAADPHGTVFMPLDFMRYHRELRGEHSGIGVQVDAVGGQIVITDVSSGGPAAQRGLSSGDVLLDVDGVPLAGTTPDQVLGRLHGAEGTVVFLTVRRTSGSNVRMSIPRVPIRENPTRSKMVESHIGYLRLLEFSEGASSDVGRALGMLTDAGATALLLDLRENGGGLLDEAIGVGSAFLSDGIVAMEEHRGTLNPLAVTLPPRRFTGLVAVLVNRFTASASEVVAGALQDVGAPLVGGRTFGKATVQTIYPLPAGWGLRLTTARYYTRRGRQIDGQGLRPDFPVPMDGEQIQSPQDVQLREATTMLRARMAAGTSRRP